MSNDIDSGEARRAAGDALDPLPGEPGIPNVAERSGPRWSKKGLVAVALLTGSLVTVAALSIQRLGGAGERSADDRLLRDRPAAATADTRKLDLPAPVHAPAASANAPVRIPAIDGTEDEPVEPIGVRRGGVSAHPANGQAQPVLPEDAPVLLVSTAPGPSHAGTPADAGRSAGEPLDETRRNLEQYQQQLQSLLATLTKSAAAAASGDTPGVAASTGAPSPASLPTLSGAAATGMSLPTPSQATARALGDRTLTLPKGTAFTCALKTRVISATSGMIGCQVQRNVYGDDGRVLLIERGSHVDGEYRVASVRPGTVRIPVLWTRVRTPHGVTVDIASPGIGQLGEAGIDGYVDNRWRERIGAAMLLSLIDDSVKLVIQNQANESNADTIVLPSTIANTSKLAEKVLESTINIPPLIYQNQGGIVGIYVARDVDFSSVYELKPVLR